jgi:hypothetical protein
MYLELQRVCFVAGSSPAAESFMGGDTVPTSFPKVTFAPELANGSRSGQPGLCGTSRLLLSLVSACNSVSYLAPLLFWQLVSSTASVNRMANGPHTHAEHSGACCHSTLSTAVWASTLHPSLVASELVSTKFSVEACLATPCPACDALCTDLHCVQII